MKLKIFVLMLIIALSMCFSIWFFVFRNLKFSGVEVLSYALYLLIISSFIILALQT